MKRFQSKKSLLSLLLSASLMASSVVAVSTVAAEGYRETEIPAFTTESTSYTYGDTVWAVSTAEELMSAAAMETDFAGITIVLQNDITLTEAWTPIASFAGKLDGNGHKISGLKLNATAADSSNANGLTRLLKGGAEVCNLIIDGAVIEDSANTYVGVLAGKAEANADIKITNVAVTSLNATATTHSLGGMLGAVSGTAKVLFDGCDVSGALNGNLYTAGYVGRVETATAVASFKDSKNSATVTADPTGNQLMAGFVGYSYTVTFERCANEGDVTGKAINKHCHLAGFVGECGASASFTDSYNSGKIETLCTGGYTLIGGGFIGWARNNVSDAATLTFTNCKNVGDVQAKSTASGGNKMGGFVGVVNRMNNNMGMGTLTFTDCFNGGNVHAGARAGGFVGQTDFGGTFTRLTNTGDVRCAARQAGGIVAQYNATNATTVFSGCFNTGDISSDVNDAGEFPADRASSQNDAKIGGILGYMDKAGTMTITDCINVGDIKGSNCSGGIMGYAQNVALSIENCSTDGAVKAGYNAAGILGRANSNNGITIKNCAVTGDISSQYTAGANTGVFWKCNNGTAPVVTDSHAYVTVNGTETAADSAQETTTNAFAAAVNAFTVMNLTVQKSALKDGAFDAIFLAGVNELNYSGIGFEVLRIEDQSAPTSFSKEECKTVYLKLKGFGEDGAVAETTAEAMGVSYLSAMAIRNIPADRNVTIVYRPYVVAEDGSAVIYGAVNAITFAN